MRTKFDKTLRISGDLMLYCHNHGATELNAAISEGEGIITYTVSASPVDITDEQLEGLTKRLNAPRCKEIEQDYWELMGESDDFSELTLVGMMCDEASIVYEDRLLKFTLLRYD
jgi:hypothetical protein